MTTFIYPQPQDDLGPSVCDTRPHWKLRMRVVHWTWIPTTCKSSLRTHVRVSSRKFSLGGKLIG